MSGRGVSFEVVGHTDDADWLDHRKSGIGASEMSAVLGVSRWATPLDVYLDKTGAEPREVGEAAYWGHRLESIVLDELAKRAEIDVTPDGRLLRSAAHEWALATLDGHTWDGRQIIPVEAKTAGQYFEDEWADGAPEGYRVQVHQQMLVTGAPYAYLAVLLGGNRFMWSRIERDEALIALVIAKGHDMWRRVRELDPPPATAPGDKLATLRQFPEDDGEVVELGADFADLVEQLDEAKRAVKEAQDREKALAAQVQQQIGSASKVVTAAGWGATWKTQERSAYTVKAAKTRVLRIQKPKKSEGKAA